MRACPAVSHLSFFALSSLASAVCAQTLNVEALYGTIVLEGGFLPDPQVMEVVPGGRSSAEMLGADCVGYIYGDKPDLKLELRDAGEQLGIFVSSDEDTTLVVNDPFGNWHCSDDLDFLGSNPGLLFEYPADGIYDIWVGTYDYVDDFAYAGSAKLVITEWDMSDWPSLDLSVDAANAGIDFGDDLSRWANDGECDDPRFNGEGSATTLVEADRYHDATDCRTLYERGAVYLVEDVRNAASGQGVTQRGRLDSSDPVLDGRGHVDRYSYQGTAGELVVFDLQSAEFDTYLALVAPSGRRYTNDDFEGSQQRSLLALQLTESGEYQVEVTSYAAGETGSYTLTLSGNLVASENGVREYEGRLERGDDTYGSGEYVDTWTFDGMPGETVTIALYSDDFDAYLVLESPDGNHEANDDAGDGSTNSRIVRELSALGTYRVRVTSYAAAETGRYKLTIAQERSGQQQVTRDSIELSLGDRVNGRLEEGDQRAQDNSFEDVYVFSAEAGEQIVIDMSSSEFDTYLSLVTPPGELITNDDFDGRTDLSRIELTLRRSGRYRILAGSYEAQATGAYTLSLTRGRNVELSSNAANATGGEIHGIFVGVADYPGEENDLPLTDDDAVRVREALIEGAGMAARNAHTLINGQATKARFREAIAAVGARADADDMVVIFFSGHGDRVARPGGPDSRDPDGFDETIELYDGALTDDELADLLDGIDAGTVLLVLDSCFSGGFAKDIVSKPGRMGLFSSEEDVLSQVAFKFQAGGYLAAFFDEALRGRKADVDGDGQLTALELSEYLHDRYRADVKSFGEDARSAGPSASYQHLVVDRGGVEPYSVLFQH